MCEMRRTIACEQDERRTLGSLHINAGDFRVYGCVAIFRAAGW